MNVEIEQANSDNIGALLRASRDRLGEDVYAVSRALRIRHRYLQAIEDGAYDDLPGPTYAVGFARAYAEYVGLDGEEVVRRFKVETSALDGSAELRFPSPIPESGVPGGAVLLIGLLIAGLTYGAWYVFSERDGFLAEVISPLPERFRSLVDGDDAERGSAQTVAERSTPDSAPPASPGTSASASPKPEPANATANASPMADNAERTSAPDVSPATDTSSYPPPPLPGGEAADREVVVAEVSRPAEASSNQTSGAASPDTTATSDADAASATSQDSDPSDEAESDVVGETAVPQPVAAIATPEDTANPDLSADAQEGETSDAESVEASANADGVETAPAPTIGDVDPAPVVEEQAPASSPPARDSADNEPGQTAGDSPMAENRVAAAATDPTPDEGSVVTARTAGPISAGRVFGDTDEVRIVVRARIDSFIQVRDDGANRMLVTRLLRAGGVYRVPDRPGLTLSTGNAGALDILVDGEIVPSIGGDGIVLQGVALDVERLRTGSAASE